MSQKDSSALYASFKQIGLWNPIAPIYLSVDAKVCIVVDLCRI